MIQLSANILFRGHCWNSWVWAYLTEPLVQAIAAIGIILGLLSTFGSLWWVSVVLLHPYHKLFSLMRRLRNNLGNATQRNATQHNTTENTQTGAKTHTQTQRKQKSTWKPAIYSSFCVRPVRTWISALVFPAPEPPTTTEPPTNKKKNNSPPQKKTKQFRTHFRLGLLGHPVPRIHGLMWAVCGCRLWHALWLQPMHWCREASSLFGKTGDLKTSGGRMMTFFSGEKHL